MNRHRLTIVVASIVFGGATLISCGAAPPGADTHTPSLPTHTSTTTSTTIASTATTSTPITSTQPDGTWAEASAQLATLAVKGRAPKTGYSRAEFGQSWTDDVGVDGGHNGCDTRNDILRRDLSEITLKPGTRGCVVLTGTLHDPYSGTTVPFTRGATTSAAVQIDHVVALSDAWQKGAQQLTLQQRTDLANDPRNLQATVGTVNQRKGAGDAATWLPPAKSYRCTYVSRQIEVKATYGLWVTAAEKSAMGAILDACPQ